MDESIKNILFEQEILKTNMETVALQIDLDKLKSDLKEYAPMITLIDLRKDIKDLVKAEDFRILEKQFETVKVDNSSTILFKSAIFVSP